MKLTYFAIAMLAASPAALAQTTPPAGSPAATPPAATDPAKPGMFHTRSQDDMRASNLLGATVKNDANETIGEINELLFSRDGRVVGVVIGVGGFLGIGQREVAMDFKALRIEKDPSAMTDAGSIIIKVNQTKDSLKAAPEWKWPTASPGTPTTPPANKPTPDRTPR
jgi:hypothetical protein